MPMAEMIVMELEQEAKTTRRVLQRVPEDKLSWKPHEKSMSLGKLARHVATAPGFLAGAAAQDVFEFKGQGPSEAKTKKELLDAFDQNVAAAKETLKKIDDARLMASWQATGGGKTLMTIPRIAMIRALVMNHTYHHRGQLSVYLRLLDVPVPSIYGPSADESPFA
jgi:uncharacterized damage-inducible protein DinB